MSTKETNKEEEQPTSTTEETNKDSNEDTLAAMKKRIAMIEAEAKKINEMSQYEDADDILASTKSVTPNTASSNPPSKNSLNGDSLNLSEQPKNGEAKNSDNQNDRDEVLPPKKDDETWPSTVEEQQELDARSVFIKNLDKAASAEELKEFFQSCGTIERITIVCDKYSAQPKGCAYIQFKSVESVSAACLLNSKPFKGRDIKVENKRTNLPPWLRFRGGGRGGRGRGYRGRGRGSYYNPGGYYQGGYGYYRGGGRGYRGRGYWPY